MTVKVTDHAVLRYLERVKGLDVEAARAEILGNGREKIMDQLQSCNVPVGNGMVALVSKGVVLTVRPKPSLSENTFRV